MSKLFRYLELTNQIAVFRVLLYFVTVEKLIRDHCKIDNDDQVNYTGSGVGVVNNVGVVSNTCKWSTIIIVVVYIVFFLSINIIHVFHFIE